jgi:hypothetical protein
MVQGSEPSSDASGPVAEEWSGRALDLIDQGLDVVHDRVLRPALLLGRSVVFGVVIAVVAVVIVILLAVAVVRLLDVYAFGDRVWASDALFGTVLCSGGFGIWSRRSRRPAGR